MPGAFPRGSDQRGRKLLICAGYRSSPPPVGSGDRPRSARQLRRCGDLTRAPQVVGNLEWSRSTGAATADIGVFVRSRRCADRYRPRAYRRVEGDVRLLPAGPGRARARTIRRVRPGRGPRSLCGRQTARGWHPSVSGLTWDRPPRGTPGGSAGRADGAGPGEPQERDRVTPDPPPRGAGLSGVRRLRAGRAGCWAAPGGGVVEHQLP